MVLICIASIQMSNNSICFNKEIQKKIQNCRSDIHKGSPLLIFLWSKPLIKANTGSTLDVMKNENRRSFTFVSNWFSQSIVLIIILSVKFNFWCAINALTEVLKNMHTHCERNIPVLLIIKIHKNTNTVKPVLVVTSIKQPTCIKQPEESCPKIHIPIYLNCIKQPPAFSSQILSFPWVAA